MSGRRELRRGRSVGSSSEEVAVVKDTAGVGVELRVKGGMVGEWRSPLPLS